MLELMLQVAEYDDESNLRKGRGEELEANIGGKRRHAKCWWSVV